MTADEFCRIAAHLTRGAFVKSWIHYNYPCDDPWVMALSVLGRDGEPERVLALERRGFGWDARRGVHFVERTCEDGTPYRTDHAVAGGLIP